MIIEVSSPFWPITALAISMTSGAVGLSPFADPLDSAGSAGVGVKKASSAHLARFDLCQSQEAVLWGSELSEALLSTV